MKFDTHVCLVSAQATPNLIAAIDEQWRPRRVILATSTEMAGHAKHLGGVLRRRGIVVEPLEIENAYDYHGLYATFFELLAGQPAGVALNVTGGTKIMAMAAQEAFRDAKAPVFYVNVQSDEILVLGKPAPNSRVTVKITLGDFLAAHGYTFVDGIKPVKLSERAREEIDLTHRIVDGVERFGPSLGDLNAIAARARDSLSGKLDERQGDSIVLNEIIDLFVEGGHVRRDKHTLRFTNEASRQFVAGGWLEQHVFSAMAEAAGRANFADYGMNMRTLAPNGTTSNEIDGAFLHRNTLHLIESKAANLAIAGNSGDDKGTEALYKLETLHRMGGLRTRGMLIDYRGRLSITNGKGDKKRVEANYARAKAANIRIVSGAAIKTLKSEISQWIE